ncbi:hypothetical protein [Lacipirellula sp.]|uniref:hypothetical protein n=1 Tax=Lacipirellula sp. TaxID=2691419 RepID=UPI003D125112
MNQLPLQFDAPAPRRRRQAAPRRKRPSLRQELEARVATLAKFSPARRLQEANQELLQQRRHD